MSELPDPEAIFVAALRAQTPITALVATRISTKLGAVFPAVRVRLISGPSRPVANTGRPLMQWESWADDEAMAALLAQKIDGVADQLAGTYAMGKIVSSWPVGQYFHSDDEATNRQRYIGQIGIFTQ
jgi:hypothetical protein